MLEVNFVFIVSQLCKQYILIGNTVVFISLTNYHVQLLID